MEGESLRDWLPLAVQLSLFAAILFGSRWARKHRPDGWFVREFLSPAFLTPSGPYEIASKRDLLIRGGRILGVSIVAFTGGVIAGLLAQDAEPFSMMALSLETWSFMLVLLSPVLGIYGMFVLVQALRRKSITITGDLPHIAWDLVGFLRISSDFPDHVRPWPDFSVIRYVAPELELVREELVRLFPRDRPPHGDEDGARLRDLAERAEASARTLGPPPV